MGYRTAFGARILAALGDEVGATGRLALAFGQGYGRFFWQHTAPELLPLRGYGPFERLMAPKDGPIPLAGSWSPAPTGTGEPAR